MPFTQTPCSYTESPPSSLPPPIPNPHFIPLHTKSLFQISWNFTRMLYVSRFCGFFYVIFWLSFFLYFFISDEIYLEASHVFFGIRKTCIMCSSFGNLSFIYYTFFCIFLLFLFHELWTHTNGSPCLFVYQPFHLFHPYHASSPLVLYKISDVLRNYSSPHFSFPFSPHSTPHRVGTQEGVNNSTSCSSV